MTNSKDRDTKPVETLTDVAPRGTRILAVAPLGALETLLRASDIGGIMVVPYDMLTATILEEILPDLILAPLLAPSFDIVDVGARLNAIGFRGPLRAFAPPLPDAVAVVREVRSQFQGIDFALVECRTEQEISG